MGPEVGPVDYGDLILGRSVTTEDDEGPRGTSLILDLLI